MAKQKKGQEVQTSVEVVHNAPNNFVCEGKTEANNGKGKIEAHEGSCTQVELDDIDEHLDFLSRRFSKLKFKRNPNMSKLSSQFIKEGQQNKTFVDKFKFKCFNYGIDEHFSNECRKPKVEKKGITSDGIDYKNK